MDLDIDYNLVESQKLLLTPRLRQAFEILRMSSQELRKYISEQLEINPVLDISEFEEYFYDDMHLTADAEVESNGDRISHQYTVDDEDLNAADDYATHYSLGRLNLKDYLTIQLNMLNLDKCRKRIGQYIIGNIDEDGYLKISIPEIAAFFNVPSRKVWEVVGRIQCFDPPGVCARSLRECLLIQLRQMGCTDGDVYRIVANFLKELAEDNVLKVIERTGLSYDRVTEIFRFIRSLEPRPGRQFSNCSGLSNNMPDILIRKIRNQYEALVNEEMLPVININRRYRKMLEENEDGVTEKYLQNRINNAHWLIKCIEQRKMILKKIAECLIRHQQVFFERGFDFLVPLRMETAAEELEMDETILRNAISGKFIYCSWGVLEMPVFFT